jgi:tetratricopeptide (TPR) repeat protein
MIDDNELIQFGKSCDEVLQKTYSNFHEMEVEYCNLINECTILRKKLLSTPDIDKSSLSVLQNQTRDLSLLDEKYKPILKCNYLVHTLITNYKKLIPQLMQDREYEQVISVYERMFNFTHDYEYCIFLADVYLKGLTNPQKSLEIYKKIEPYVSNNLNFLWGISDVYFILRDYYHQCIYLQKAIELQLKNGEENV